MADWDDNIITKFIDTMMTSQETGRPLSVTNAQIKILYEITNELLLSQIIHENTRLNNIIDLFFTNDEYCIQSIESIKNISFSDHNIMKICTNISFSKQDTSDEDYPYSTEIPRYNLLEGTDDNWSSLNSFYDNLS